MRAFLRGDRTIRGVHLTCVQRAYTVGHRYRILESQEHGRYRVQVLAVVEPDEWRDVASVDAAVRWIKATDAEFVAVRDRNNAITGRDDAAAPRTGGPSDE